jgi:hypothetical protein
MTEMTATITPPTQRRTQNTRAKRLLCRVGWAAFALFAIKGLAWIVLAVAAALLAGR